MGDNHYLILGGARSGKSALAEKIALKLSPKPAYIATGQKGDKEFAARIQKHRSERSDCFTTIEEPLTLAQTLDDAAKLHDTILVDCLTLWLSNLIFDPNSNVQASFEVLVETLKSIENCKIILVSNEVGLGIVPENALARDYRDNLGRLHQMLGAQCGHVIMVMAGLPLAFKGKIPKLE